MTSALEKAGFTLVRLFCLVYLLRCPALLVREPTAAFEASISPVSGKREPALPSRPRRTGTGDNHSLNLKLQMAPRRTILSGCSRATHSLQLSSTIFD